MIYIEQHDQNVVVFIPDGPLDAVDFQKLGLRIAALLGAYGKPVRLMIRVPSFPGWRNTRALMAHIRFVAIHHRQAERIAVVTDTGLLKLVPRLAKYLLHPDIRVFKSGELEAAVAWLGDGTSTSAQTAA